MGLWHMEQHGTQGWSPRSHGRAVTWNYFNRAHPMASIRLGDKDMPPARGRGRPGYEGRKGTEAGPMRKVGVQQT